MNWIGGARARVQQLHGDPFVPRRRGRPQYQQPLPDISVSSTSDIVPPPRKAYQCYDVSSDPRYELVEKKSDDGIRHRTVPLLDTVKRLFPNGDVLSLQLSHQMEITKMKPRRSAESIAVRPESGRNSTANGRSTAPSSRRPRQISGGGGELEEDIQDQDDDDLESNVSKYRYTPSIRTPVSPFTQTPRSMGSYFGSNYFSEVGMPLELNLSEEVEMGEGRESRQMEEEERSHISGSVSSFFVSVSQKGGQKPEKRIRVDTAVSADEYFKQTSCGEDSQDSGRPDKGFSQSSGFEIQRNCTGGSADSFITVAPIEDASISAESLEPNAPTPTAVQELVVLDQAETEDNSTILTGAHHSSGSATTLTDQPEDTHFHSPCSEPPKSKRIKSINTFTQ